MKNVTIEEWATFLENNGHLQTVCCLKRMDGTMCCLGALCELSEIPTTSRGDDVAYIFDDDLKTGLPPTSFMKNYNLSDNGTPLCYGLSDNGTPLGKPRIRVGSLSMMNDSGVSWKEVAKTLREWKENGWIHDPA